MASESEYKFAFVEFVDDKIKYTTTINNIKKFNIHTFNANENKKYKVLYRDDAYYKAYVICVGVSKEDVEKKARETRIRHKPRRLVEDTVDDTTSNDDAELLLNATQKVVTHTKKKKLDSSICSSNYEDITDGAIGSYTSSYSHKRPESTELEELKMEVEQLKRELGKVKKENDNLKHLNRRLQEEVINKFKDFSMTEQLNVPRTMSEGDVPIGGVFNEKIHLGRGIFLPRQIYDSAALHPPKKDGLFIKELAVAVFGTKTLMESSITGMACNKTGGPAKPPLNPTKLLAITDIVAYRLQQRNESTEMIAHVCDSVKAKIREKMNDLTKPSRRVVRNKENTAAKDDKLHTTPTESADTENVTLI